MPDIFLYSGQPNTNDIRLTDPSVLDISGTGEVTFTVGAFDASGTETVDGSAGEVFGVAALAATGVETFTGTGAEVFAVAAVDGAGAESFSAIASETFGPAAFAADGLETFTGSGDVAFSADALSGSGSEAIDGSADEAFAVSALAASGAETFTGSGAETFGVAALAAAALQGVEGSATVAFAGPQLDGTSAQAFTGTGSETFRSALSGTAIELFTTTFQKLWAPPQLGSMQLGCAAFPYPVGTSGVRFAVAGLAASENETVTGSGSVEFDAPAIAAAGSVAQQREQVGTVPPRPFQRLYLGTADVTIRHPTLRGRGQAIIGTASVTADRPAIAARGDLAIIGQSDVVVAVGVHADGSLEIHGTAAVVAALVSVEAIGAVDAIDRRLRSVSPVVAATRLRRHPAQRRVPVRVVEDSLDIAWRALQQDEDDVVMLLDLVE